MKVYVVMGNDFPDSVWSTEEKANAAIEQNKAAEIQARSIAHGSPVYYKVHTFGLDNAPL